MGLRPFSVRSCICLVSMVVATCALSVWTSALEAVTSTDSHVPGGTRHFPCSQQAGRGSVADRVLLGYVGLAPAAGPAIPGFGSGSGDPARSGCKRARGGSDEIASGRHLAELAQKYHK